MLSLEDLGGKEPVVTSALNSKLLDAITAEAFSKTGRGNPLPYFSQELHVYFTVSNLRGIPYSVDFTGGSYGMQSRGDRIHYVVTGLGSTVSPSPWASKDAGESLDVADVVPATPKWKAYGIAAVASGAFPVGLAPRLLESNTSAYQQRYIPIDMPKLAYYVPRWPKTWFDPDPRNFNFLSVDGGVINNEPFEYARYTLMTHPPARNLVKRDQIAGWGLAGLPADMAAQDVRNVLAELAQPAFDYRTPAGISAAVHIPEQQVRRILAFLKPQTGKPYAV